MIEISIARNLRVRGCPACNGLEQRMAEYFAERQGLLSRSEEAQSDYADSGGFCPLHTWQLAQFSSPRGIAKGHEMIIRRMAERLYRLADVRVGKEVGSIPLKVSDDCNVCHFLADAEARYIETFCVFLEDEDNLCSYELSHGLCLRHLQRVLARIGDETKKSRLLRSAACRLREIGESMTQYNRKHTELKRELLTPDEKDAYRRGLVMLSGERTVFSPFMKRL